MAKNVAREDTRKRASVRESIGMIAAQVTVGFTSIQYHILDHIAALYVAKGGGV
jgi:hypothetical protein